MRPHLFDEAIDALDAAGVVSCRWRFHLTTRSSPPTYEVIGLDDSVADPVVQR